MAALAVHALDGWRVVARTPTESGADYWMVRDSEVPADHVRLEVSGMARGTGTAGRRALARRLRIKIEQLRNGKATEPGLAAVVGFELLHILVSEMVGQ